MKKFTKTITTNVCLECSKKGGCCSGNLSVPVTIKDIKRIEKLGYKKEYFLTLKRYSKKEIVGPEKWWLESFIDINGEKYKIHLKTNGNHCIFLKNRKGCILADKRTLFCKIYPFWIYKGKVRIEKGDGIHCNVNFGKFTHREKIIIMGETNKKLKKYFSEIRNDSLNKKSQHKKIAASLLH